LKPGIRTKSDPGLGGRLQSTFGRFQPSSLQRSNRLSTALWLLAFVAVSCAFWFWLYRHDPRIFRENGPMENFQAASLLVGILFLVRAVWHSDANPARRLFLGGLIVFYGTLVLMEFDVRPFHIPALTWLLSGTVRNLCVACAWLGAFALFLRRVRATWREFLAWLSTPGAPPLLLAGIFWVSGWLLEHAKFFPARHQNMMAEELMEANAAPLMLASAILTWRIATRPRKASQVVANADLPLPSGQVHGTDAKPSL